MELKWEIILGLGIVICATVATCLSHMSEQTWLTTLTHVLAFLGGAGYGVFKARKS